MGNITTDISWIKNHERLLIIIFVLASILYLGNKYINYAAENATVKSDVAKQLLQKDVDAANQLAQEAKADAQSYKDLVQSLANQNASLSTAIASRNVQLGKQQAVDQTLPLTALKERFKALVPITDSDISVSTTNLTLTDNGARNVLYSLEQVPVLQANLVDMTTKADNNFKEEQACSSVLDKQNKLIDAQQNNLKDTQTACQLEIKSIKAQDRKAKRNWFLRGAGVGAAVVTFVVLHFGI